MRRAYQLGDHLAQTIVVGEWNQAQIENVLKESLGDRRRWIVLLVERLLAVFPRRPSSRQIASFFRSDKQFRRQAQRRSWDVNYAVSSPPQMVPAVGRPAEWSVRSITTSRQLADWLGLSAAQLDHAADTSYRERDRPEPLQNYAYRWLRKRLDGCGRLLEMPKYRLKRAQRRILCDILDHIPPHAAAHGFVQQRSIHTAVAEHIGQEVVVRMDLQNFFACIRPPRVRRIFLTVGYPEPIAKQLCGLCTNVPARSAYESLPGRGFDVSDRWRHMDVYDAPHLPQGAPTSPALANLVAFRMDRRLAGLAATLNAQYTRYADDIVFSGSRHALRNPPKLVETVEEIACNEGFQVNQRKTHVMRASARQRVYGLVVNEKPNVSRRQFDQLKATLYNCIRYGVKRENRMGVPNFREHLTGRVQFVETVNPQRGRRLRELLEQVQWEE